MITKKKLHPYVDRRQILIDIKQLQRNAGFFRGQPAILLEVLRKMTHDGTKPVLARRFREYLEKNRKALFPKGTTHRDLWRIYSIWHASFKRAEVIEEIEVA
jgi:hypothetical protein